MAGTRTGNSLPDNVATTVSIAIEMRKKAEVPPTMRITKEGATKLCNNGQRRSEVNYAPGNGNVMIVGDKRL